MSNPVNILGKYGIGPWGEGWGSIWYIKPNNWNWWNWWSWWVEYKFSNSANWIWNIPNAQNDAPSNEPIIFTYTYNNTTNNDINALLYYICDNVGKFYVNNRELIETTDYGRQRLPFVLNKGINKIEAVCINFGGPAGLIVDVQDIKTQQILFSTNSDWRYDTNYTKNLFNDSYCYNNTNNGYVNIDNVGFGIDMKDDVKTFEDGEYLLLARQTVNGNYFDKKVAMTHKLNHTDPNSENYMNGTLLNSSHKIDGKYTFKLVWKGSGLPPQIWKQTSDPFKSKKVDGYEGIYIANNQNYWGGLRFNGRQCVLSGSTNDWWYYAVGSFAQWNNAIPGPYNAVQNVELYVLKPKIGNYNNLGYVYTYGNDITYENISLDKCAERCDQIQGCTTFAQNKSANQGCWFKTKAENKYGPYWWSMSYTKDLENPNNEDLVSPKKTEYKPIGGYRDNPNRAIPAYFGCGFNAETCSKITKQNGYKYFGLQYPPCGTQCFGGNDLNRAKMYGSVATSMQGGPWANYVYENIKETIKEDTTELGCIKQCNEINNCVGYSFDKSKISNNCNMFKKLPKYYNKNSSKKIAFKPNNISNFNNLSTEEKNKIKKQCGSKFLSKKFNVEENIINKCISLTNNGSQTSGFNVDPTCLYNNLPQDSPLKKNNLSNNGLDNKFLDAAVKNDAIDKNIADYYKYIDKEVEFANLNNKEILKEPSNSQEYNNEFENVRNSGGLDYLKTAKKLNNEIINILGTKENFSNFESKYLDNVKYNQKKWYFIGLFIILLIILLYYFKF
jgi:hypothetical protein